MHKKRVLIWAVGIDDINSNGKQIGGITVQMMLWAQAFNNNGSEVFSLTKNIGNHLERINNINYIHLKEGKFLNILFEQFYTIYLILRFKPSTVVTRGASRRLFILSILSKIFFFKLIHMVASDSDVEVGSELINKPWDRKMYRYGLRKCENVVVQNNFQNDAIKKMNRGIRIVKIPNIWPQAALKLSEKTIILWVANFRSLKRPEWFLDVAEKMPNENFVMVGMGIDEKLYNYCWEKSKLIPNLEFKGGLTFSETNKLFSRCKVFICTSTIEGFPNTFLQAWSNKVPVISTFDPSDVIQINHLGFKVASTIEIMDAIEKLNKIECLNKVQKNIEEYFNIHHDSLFHFKLLRNEFLLKSSQS